QPAVGDRVEHGDLAGELQRVVEDRQHRAGDQLRLLAALGCGRQEQQRIGRIAAIRVEIMLHGADMAPAVGIGELAESQAFVEILLARFLRRADIGKELHPEIHEAPPNSAVQALFNIAMTVFTIGHSTRSIEDFIAALKAAGVGKLADIRRFPKSRRFPHFNGENLAPALAAEGIGYRHFPELGGRRGKRADGQPSPNTLWRQEPFRNYADYAETPEFRAAFDKLTALTHENTV